MSEKVKSISKKYSDTVLSTIFIIGAILTALWYSLKGIETIWIPVAIICASALLFIYILKPKMIETLSRAYPSKK